MKSFLSTLIILLFAAGTMAQETEHLRNPLGLDAAHPRLSWKSATSQIAYQLIVEGTWNTGKIKSGSQLTVYNGKALQPFTKYNWKVKMWDKDGKVSETNPAFFETGMMSMQNWKGSWITDTKDIALKPAAEFNKAFSITKKIVSARAYIAVAGLCELTINGNRVGDHFLDPMYTRFDRRNLYVTYDLTGQLRKGDNDIRVLLGNGWYNLQSTAVWNFDKAPWRSRPGFCMDLRITYTDGSVETISTDKSWQSTLSQVTFNSIYTGEHQDANVQDTARKKVIYASAPSNNIVAQTMYSIRLTDTIPAAGLAKLNDSDYVFDLGRNIAGISQIKLKAEPGTIIRLKHGERIYHNGHVDESNIDVHYRPTDDTDPFQTDIYKLKGDGTEETFKPHFNYKGFRYVEVISNKPVQLRKESLIGYFVHSDVPAIGFINSSNPTLNKIWQATNSSYLSNLMGYPTDCPQREKNGWTGDAQIAVETGLYNFDAITIYEKWMADIRDEQQPNGDIPSIVPTGGWGYEWGNGPDWTSAIAIIPWNLYLFYGDSKCLFDCYGNIKRYVDHINELYPSGLCSWGLGDWIPVKSKAPVELTSTCYYYADVVILAKAAKLFHKKNDAIYYGALAQKIKSAFNQKYLHDGVYGSGLQTELSVPLYWGLVPDDQKKSVSAHLAERVIADSVQLDVGLLGSKAILNALSENGYANLAYQLASRETYPSWGWWIKNRATTLYENWPVDAARDISENHIMFGEISAWFYKALGGIKPDPDQPGFHHILLQPCFVKGLTHFSASHDGPYGKIKSSWVRNNGGIAYDVTIPPNSTATLVTNLIRRELSAGSYHFQIKPTNYVQ